MRLLLGQGQPANAPSEIYEALSAVEVIRGTTCPAGFRLSFVAERLPPPGKGSSAPDYPLLDTDLLDPFTRVQITVQPEGSSETVLIDGYITHQELTLEGQETAVVTVLGEDLSVKMDLVEVSAEYQNLADSAIVRQILDKYSSLGLTAKVTAPEGESAPKDWVPQQNATDRYHVQMLAARHAFLFYLEPGSSPGSNTAYWGPPISSGESQKALTTNLGPADNLRALSLRHEGLAATATYGNVLDLTQQPASVVQVGAGSTSRSPAFATTPAMGSSVSSLAQDPSGYTSKLDSLDARGSLLYHAGMPVADARSLAQAKTDRSVRQAIVAEGEVETARYGAILQAPGLVDLRGVGKRYDGTYYVDQVHHVLSLEVNDWSYLQRFRLRREGTGSTITEVGEA